MAETLIDLLPAFETPGEAFSQQARWERRLEIVFEREVREFLFHVKQEALGRNLTSANVRQAWNRAIDRTVEPFDVEIRVMLRAGFAEFDLGTDAYHTALAVYSTWSSYRGSVADLEQLMTEALSLDTPSLQAAGVERRGMNWMARTRAAVRTTVTGLFGRAALIVLPLAGYNGKMWVSKRDDAVRETHAIADGTVLYLDRPFLVGGYSLMYPGDRRGPAAEAANCRCVIVGRKIT